MALHRYVKQLSTLVILVVLSGSPAYADTGFEVWVQALKTEARSQGTDPALLDQRPQAVISAARNLLTRMSPHPGHVFNLGHGIRPTAKIECVEALVETVTKHSNQN